MKYDVVLDIQNEKEEFNFTDIAKQSNGSVWFKCGKTVLLATVVVDYDEVVDDEFLPLTVQYIEKSYAAGKIPGGFFKRETKPGDFETLTSRIVDRSLRPLFPKGFAHPVVITVMVFSVDKVADLQRLALTAASAALYVSDLDINKSITSVRVAKVDGEIIYNPTLEELKNSTLDLYLSGSRDELLMIELRSIGSDEAQMIDFPSTDPLLDPSVGIEPVFVHKSNAISEDELIEIIDNAQKILFENNKKYEEAFKPYQKESKKLTLISTDVDEEIYKFVKTNHLDDIKEAIKNLAKSERNTELKNIAKKIKEHLEADEEDILKAVEKVKKEEVRRAILQEKTRADGRALDEIRPITIETNLLPSAHSSALFTRGQTQALVVLTIGTTKDAQMFENLTDDTPQNENFMVHYNFPGFSVGEASAITGVKRRELGHGNLAKRALEPIIKLDNQSIRLVSEILESNGSSSMATVCGGYLALKAADIETTEPIAGIAMGLVTEGEKYAILSDIMGLEDHDGDMDFKVAGSKDGITALQMDIKLGGISLDILKEALYQAKKGREHIIDIMLEAEKNIVHNEGVLPSSHHFHIEPSYIVHVIGQAGKTIKEIIEKFEVAIDLDKKSGKVKITGTKKENIHKAKEYIEGIVKKVAKTPKIEYKVGQRYKAKVARIVDFGAFVELPDGTDGLVHISKLAPNRVENVRDVVKEGDEIEVEVIELKGDKVSLAKV